MKLYSTVEAAEYLGVDVGVIKHHYRVSKKLSGQLKGSSLIFAKADLDKFQARPRSKGRPPKQIARAKKALADSGVAGEVVIKRGRFVHFVQNLDDQGQPRIIRLDRPPSQMSHREMVANIRRAAS